MTRGETIRHHRERRKLTQVQLAELFGVKPNTVYRWEADRDVPSDENKRKLHEQLRVPLASLV